MQSILLEFELQPNWRAAIVACKLPVLSALRRFSVLVGGRLAFRRIIRRKATTRASLHFFAFIPLFVLGPSKLAKSCEKTPLFGCLMVTALPGPAALRTLWLPHGNGFCLSTLFLPIEPPMNTEPKKSARKCLRLLSTAKRQARICWPVLVAHVGQNFSNFRLEVC